MKIKVVHFTGEYYRIKYQLHWWLPYRSINSPETGSTDPSLDHLNGMMASPLIMPFDEAKRFAESFTETSLREYLRRQVEDFDRQLNMKRQVLKDRRSKSFSMKNP